MLSNKSQLIKVLGMLGSTYDGEILAAAKLAEKIRKSMHLTWEQLLNPQIKTITKIIEREIRIIEEIPIKIILIKKYNKKLSRSQLVILNSIQLQYKSGKSLTDKQITFIYDLFINTFFL